MIQRPDDLSCDPRKWSNSKLLTETRNGHGFPAALAERIRRWGN